MSSWVARWAALRPTETAIIFEGAEVNWSSLEARVGRTARALHTLGVRKGDRVGLLMSNRPEFLEAFFAIARIGSLVVPLNVYLTAAELAWILQDAGVRVVCTEPEFDSVVSELETKAGVEHWASVDVPLGVDGPMLRDLRSESAAGPTAIAPSDAVAILYTSGTTGFPKGAVLSHRNVHFNAVNWLVHGGHRPTDRHLVSVPLSFTGGSMTASLPALHAGGTIVIARGFEPAAALETIERLRITVMLGVPTMWKAMADHADFATRDLSSLRLGVIGAAPVPLPVLRAYAARGLPLVQAYGLTEGCGFNLSLSAQDATARVGSCGLPLLYSDARVFDREGHEAPAHEIGELVVRGPVVFDGYWNNDAATEATLVDGWLHTGDLARRDEDGYVFIVDRLKDMIISGGLNVYPAEVENALYGVAAIAEAAVLGLSHEKWGEQVTAFVVLKEGHQTTEQAVLSQCATSLAPYKLPKQVRFVHALPKTLSGKVKKHELRGVTPTL